jgi:hypothetical protein
MTVIIGINYLDTYTIVSDTRVTYDGGKYSDRYGLRKVMLLGSLDSGTLLALGFSGYLAVARPILRHVIQKLEGYRRRMVVSQFKDELQKWIQEAVPLVDRDKATQTKFLLCGFDPRRKARRIQNGVVTPMPGPLYQPHSYVYVITSKGKVNIQLGSRVTVIGSGQVFKDNFNLVAANAEGLRHPIARSYLLYEDLAAKFRDTKFGSVGGPFEIYNIIPRQGYDVKHFWSDGKSVLDHISIKKENNTLHLHHTDTGEDCTLYDLEEWCSRYLNGPEARGSEIG